MNILKLYDWPGNIRELENVIKRAVIMSTGAALRPVLGELKRLPGQTSPAAKRTLAEAERDHIVEVLRDTRWVVGGDNGAAARLGMPRTTLVYKMRKLGIAREQGSKSFRGRLSGLSDLPAETHSDLQKLPIDGTERDNRKRVFTGRNSLKRSRLMQSSWESDNAENMVRHGRDPRVWC